MKKLKIFNLLLAASLLCNISTTSIHAKEIQAKNTKEDNGIEYVKMEEVNLREDEQDINHLDRPYTGEQYTLSKSMPASDNMQKNADNTDPNYAYIVENETIAQGTIEKEKETRW